jgi:hypothetical protein
MAARSWLLAPATMLAAANSSIRATATPWASKNVRSVALMSSA